MAPHGPAPVAIPEKYKKSFVALKDVDVFFMSTCMKMSPKLRQQRRVVVFLEDQLYSCYEDGNITRHIRIPTIAELVVKGLDVVIHVPRDHDLWVTLPDAHTARRLLEVLGALYYNSLQTPLRIVEVPQGMQIGSPQYPVQLLKPDQPIYLDAITQRQPPLTKSPPQTEAGTRHRARGMVPLPPSESDGSVLMIEPSPSIMSVPPPPPPEDEEEGRGGAGGDATGLRTGGNVVVGGCAEFPTVELLPTDAEGLTQGVVTLTPEQLAGAQGGPIKINLQIMTLSMFCFCNPKKKPSFTDGEGSQLSSRVGSATPATTIPPPPSRSESGATSYRDDPNALPVHETLPPQPAQPTAPNTTATGRDTPQGHESYHSSHHHAPAESLPHSHHPTPLHTAGTPYSAAADSAAQDDTAPLLPSPAVIPAAAVPVQQPQAPPPQPHALPPQPQAQPLQPPTPLPAPPTILREVAASYHSPAEESPLGRMHSVALPNADGSVQTVQVPEASLPSVEAMVRQVHDANETLRRKDEQLSALLSLTQKSGSLKKERSDGRLQDLLGRNREAEAELELLRGELRITKQKIVAEKEAHLHDLAQVSGVGAGGNSAPYTQMATFSPGGRLPRGSAGAGGALQSSRGVSPVRHPLPQGGAEGSPHSSRRAKPARQYSHSPVPAVEPVCEKGGG